MRRLAMAFAGLVAVACSLPDHRFEDDSAGDSDGDGDGDGTPTPDAGPITERCYDDTLASVGDESNPLNAPTFTGTRPFHEAFLSAFCIEEQTRGPASHGNAKADCESRQMRLPTEHEWEHHRRQGSPGDAEWVADYFNLNAYQFAAWADPVVDGFATIGHVVRGPSVFLREPADDSQPRSYRCARYQVPIDAPPPEPVPPACPGCVVTALAAGRTHTCALRGGDGAVCWGDNSLGQLGTTTRFGAPEPAFRVVGLTAAPTAITAGWAHTCVIDGGQVKCWGANESGQCGQDGQNNVFQASAVALGGQVSAVGAAASHTCALRTDGNVFCWGADDGQGAPSGATPASVTGIMGATRLAVGDRHTCVADALDEVRCWGDVPEAATGSFASVPSELPQVTSGFAGPIVDLVAGDRHTCVLVEPTMGNREVWCWGNGVAFDETGMITITETPVKIADGARAVYASGAFTVVVATSGELDLGATVLVHEPTLGALPAGTSLAISPVGTHVCMAGGGTTRCFGENDFGQLGVGLMQHAPNTVPTELSFP